jgi:hypothetical protein
LKFSMNERGEDGIYAHREMSQFPDHGFSTEDAGSLMDMFKHRESETRSEIYQAIRGRRAEGDSRDANTAWCQPLLAREGFPLGDERTSPTIHDSALLI